MKEFKNDNNGIDVENFKEAIANMAVTTSLYFEAFNQFMNLTDGNEDLSINMATGYLRSFINPPVQ